VGAAVDVVIRQEAIQLARASGAPGSVPGAVILRSFAGARVQYVVKAGEGIELVVEAASSGPDAALEIGSEVLLAIDPSAVFATRTGDAAS
jgi:ABC-type Fe3+/spermidine/putrescine transport system ATPase subunit